MYFKKVIFFILFQAALSLFAFMHLDAEMILIDKIAATVNEEIITFTDVDKCIQFYPILRKKEESEQDFYIRALQDLINYKVVYLEYKDDFSLQEEDYEEVQTAVIEKLGSLDKLMTLLNKFDLEWQDFKDFIKERVAYEKVLKKQFQVKIAIDFKDIAAFYNEEYVPLQERLGLKPRTLIEMYSLIEQQLKKVRIQEQEKLSQWLTEIRSSYKIENKLLKEK